MQQKKEKKKKEKGVAMRESPKFWCWTYLRL